jgi:glycosyltransferase involved in cell wall biosynthesis
LGETHDVRPYLEKAHCLLFPSYREGMSRILMEAAAMETPIITTDNVGCRDIVDHNKGGFLFQNKDVDEFEKHVMTFIEMEAQDKMVMGKLGRMKIEREFDEKKVIEVYLSSVNSILNIQDFSKQDLLSKTSSKT